MPEVTNLAKDAERLAALMQYYATVKPVVDWKGESEGRFLLRQIARLTQERDGYKQASLDCHDALGKCAVERDTATRRVEALEAEVGRLQNEAEQYAESEYHRGFDAGRESAARATGQCAACGGMYPDLECPHRKNAKDAGTAAPCAPEFENLERVPDANTGRPPIVREGILTAGPDGRDIGAPAADHTERARRIAEWHHGILASPTGWQHPGFSVAGLAAEIARALTAAERAGAEKMRALDEAAIEAARAYREAEADGTPRMWRGKALQDLASALDDALAARDAALTEGEGEMSDCCNGCRFWRGWNEVEGKIAAAKGTCRRFPPAPIGRGGNPTIYESPVTRADFWCGEYEPRAALAAAADAMGEGSTKKAGAE